MSPSESLAATVVTIRTAVAEDVRFNRHELAAILSVYGRQVATGAWRDYAIHFSRERAVFAILRRAGEAPLYRIEKDLDCAEKQGAYAVIAQGGRLLKRGHELARVLMVLEKPAKIIASLSDEDAALKKTPLARGFLL